MKGFYQPTPRFRLYLDERMIMSSDTNLTDTFNKIAGLGFENDAFGYDIYLTMMGQTLDVDHWHGSLRLHADDEIIECCVLGAMNSRKIAA